MPYGSWTPAPITFDADGAYVEDVVRFRDSYYAIGGVNPETHPYVWQSRDGSGWAAGGSQPAIPVGTTWAAAANDDRIVVMTDDGGDQQSGTAFISTDGRTWTTAESPFITSIAALPDRFVGIDPDPDGFAIWTMTDGADWHKVSESTHLGGGHALRVRALRVGSSWLVVAVGANSHQSPTLWISSDRESADWHAVDLAARDVMLGDVASSGDALLVVGTAGYCCRARAWTSTDAIDWQSQGDPVDEPATSPSTVVATPSGFLVAGLNANNEGGHDLRAWFTGEGKEWTEIREDEIATDGGSLQMMPMIVRDDGSVIVVANNATKDGRWADPKAWVVEP